MRLLAVVALIVAVDLSAAEVAEQKAEKLVEKLGNNRFKLDNIVIDKNTESVRFPAKVNMTDGLLELLLCAPHGKTHESLLVTEIDATKLNLALIMIGCKPGKIKAKEQGDDIIPDGTLLTIHIAYKDSDDGEEILIRAEDWVYNKRTSQPMAHTDWVYTGSFVSDGEYLAKITGTYIVTFRDPYTIIDLPLREAADDTVYWVHDKAVKPKGFPVELIITRIKGKVPEKKEKEKAKEDSAEDQKGPAEEKKAPISG